MFEVMKRCFCSSFTWNSGQGCFQANKTKAQTNPFLPSITSTSTNVAGQQLKIYNSNVH